MTGYKKQFAALTAEGFIGLAEARHVAELLEAIDSDTPVTASPHLLRGFRRQIVASGALNNALARAFTEALATRAAGEAATDSPALQKVARQLSSVAVSKRGTVSGWVASVLSEVASAGGLYELLEFAPLAACAYELDDNGAVAGMFGYAGANVVGAALQRVDHTIVGAGLPNNGAIAVSADPFGAGAITRAGRQWVGVRVVSITELLLANAETSVWTGISICFVWGSGAAATIVTVMPQATGNGTNIIFSGLGEGEAGLTATRFIDIPFDQISVGLYCDHDAQKFGYTINGIDQGYLEGAAVTLGATIAPFCLANNTELLSLDGENVVFDFLTVPDQYTLAEGLTSICGQAIPNVLDYFGATPVNPLELTGTFAPHLSPSGQAATVSGAQFSVSGATIGNQDAFIATEPVMRAINWLAGEQRAIYLKNPGTWTYQLNSTPDFIKATPFLEIRSEDGQTRVLLFASLSGPVAEPLVPKWQLSALRAETLLSVQVDDAAWATNEFGTNDAVLTIDGDGYLHVYLDGVEMTLSYFTDAGAGQPAEPIFAPGQKILVGGSVFMPNSTSGTPAQSDVTVSAEIGTDGGGLPAGGGRQDWYGGDL